MKEVLEKVKEASKTIASLTGGKKRALLKDIAEELEIEKNYILEENKKDVDYAKNENLSSALIDRLILNTKRINDMKEAILTIASLKDPVGKVIEGWEIDNGLRIEKVKIPIGVIGIIYESRPNVTSDTAALAIMSGNAIILKGGKEAKHSNIAIVNVIQKVLEKHNLPKEIVSLIPDYSREGVLKLIQEDKYLDLIIPRGGENLIKFVTQNSKVPVVKHDKGLCHIYIDKDANLDKAIEITINAKTQRPGVCNAVETLLVNKDIANAVLPKLKEKLEEKGVELRGCEKTREIIDIKEATEEDWYTEYLDLILSIKVVDKLDEAIKHIQIYGSGHSDSIISENYSNIEEFLNRVDSACVYANASTRFTDGGVFGFGAEVGISTNKLHARGPMGIDDLTTYKYKVYGNGQIRK